MPTVTIDGDQHEVESSAIHYEESEAPEGYVSAVNHRDTIKSRVERAKRDTKKALSGDEDFLKDNFSSTFGVELRDDGKPKGAPTDDELSDLRQKAARADSLEEANSSLKEQIASGRQSRLEASITKSLDAVKPGLRDAATAQIASQFTYDEGEGAFVLEDESSRYTVENGESRLKRPGDLVASLSDDWKKDRSASGPDVDTSSSSAGGKKTYTAEEYEAKMSRSDELSDDEWTDLMDAPEEGRVEG